MQGVIYMQIEQRFITPVGNARTGIPLDPGVRWIIIHETSNPDKGANADNHYLYFNRLNTQGVIKKSCHFLVDSTKILQILPLDEVAWCNTDGRTPYSKNPPKGGNMAGISIEMCVNKDGDFEKTLEKTIWLVADLMKRFNLTINEVKQHNDFYNKNCPKILRETGRWSWFLQKVQEKYNELNSPTAQIKAGDKVKIKSNALYGGLSSARGKAVPSWLIEKKELTVSKIQINKGEKEALLKEINSWVALKYLTKTKDTPAPSTPTPITPPTPPKVGVGSTVLVNGRLYVDSYGSKGGKNLNNFKAKVSIVKTGKPFPYHVTTLQGSPLGWVSANSIKLA